MAEKTLPLEYLSCDWLDCGNEPSYYCPVCCLVYCRAHVRRYDEAGKKLEEPVCLRCFPEPKEPRHLQIGGKSDG